MAATMPRLSLSTSNSLAEMPFYNLTDKELMSELSVLITSKRVIFVILCNPYWIAIFLKNSTFIICLPMTLHVKLLII